MYPFHRFLNSRLAGALCALGLVVWTGSAGAAVLVQQGALDGGDSLFTTLSGQQLADDFSLSGASSVASISWYGAYAGDLDEGDDDFTLSLFSALAGTSGTLLQSFDADAATRSDTALLDLGGQAVYRYDYTLPSALDLGSGTYFLMVENFGSSEWLWQTSGEGDDSAFTRFDSPGSDWETLPQTNLAFVVEGERQSQPVPEPAAPALLAAAGLALLAARRRQPR